jgi:ubiquinone/menaquinone biosynthesis C-methylase UbiE
MTKVRRFQLWIGAALLAAGVAAVDAVGGAQLASRPVEEWRKVLDSPERLAVLKAGEVVARLKLKSTDVVADLGAGTGPFEVPFAKAVQSGAVYAVEVDGGFFPMIEEKAKAAGVTNVRTVLGVFTDPKLPVSNVNLAFMHDVLHHIEDRAGYLKALAKYLGPQARIAIIDYEPARSPHRDQPALVVSREQATALLAGAGFKPIEDIALFDEKWFLVFGR